ncbi:HDOD domain-containing protein [bacterium]|nr:HDOD domain-containing protein [bacterium]
MAATAINTGSALVVIGDKVAPTPYLKSLVGLLRAENENLPDDRKVQYIICEDYSTLAIALKKFRERISLVMVGPGLDGKQDMVVRMIGREIKSVLIADPKIHLAETAEQSKRLLANLLELGITVVLTSEATDAFWEPIVHDNVIAGIASNLDIASMTPEQRADHLDKRLESVTMFPSLPETQNRVAALDDMDHPKQWAEAIDRDVPMKTVILNLLNSAHYSFRSRITTIEQAVSLASARTIREVVLACTVQRLFGDVAAARIDQFWRHSVAAGYFAKILALPALSEEQSPQEKTEFSRLGLEDDQRRRLIEAHLWRKFELPRDGDPFTAGLLHDIGKVVIALCFEDALSLIDPIVSLGVRESEAGSRIWAESPRKVERSLMNDIDHQTIGGRIARRWGLAPAMQEVITQHHLVRRTSSALTRLVALSDIAANTVHSYPYEDAQHPFARLLRQVDDAVKAQGSRPAEEVVDEVWDPLVASRLDTVLSDYEVPENLWRTVDASTFFRLVYAVRPRVKRLSSTFLKMTAQAV